jgi:carbamoyltransferase
MPIILGIHNGHHASCAVVRDGIVVSAIEQERLTRIKGDGSNYLSNNLPVKECLQKAGISLDEVDLIVSSFQAIGPGGVGLMQPIMESGFNLFDPYDTKHIVVSHHYAHALSAIGTSGLEESAVLVCDLAGSTTTDGKDFKMPFTNFYNDWTNFKLKSQTKTECYSIYHAKEGKLDLLHREFCIPHCSPEIFICSPASLYDNVARFVFNKENAHGELMALASISSSNKNQVFNIKHHDIFKLLQDGTIIFKNDWQHKIKPKNNVLGYAQLASVTQKAIEIILMNYARKAKKATNSDNLVAAGGVFLNIKANSVIESSGLFNQYHVPSSPHDAGIAIGCAYYGWYLLAHKSRLPPVINKNKASDRLGSVYNNKQIRAALAPVSHLCTIKTHISPKEVARMISEGKVIARFSGAAEFGPRALGGRSLLASPLVKNSKTILNIIKGRQEWRPVAPVIVAEKIHNYFNGPADSPYMNKFHFIIDCHRSKLLALEHPDGSARVQSLSKKEDSFLFETLEQFESFTGYPVLVNTSFNGPNEPIVETPNQALNFFLADKNIDALLLENKLITRAMNPSLKDVQLAPDVVVTIDNSSTKKRILLWKQGKFRSISLQAYHFIEAITDQNISDTKLNKTLRSEISELLFQQYIIKRNKFETVSNLLNYATKALTEKKIKDAQMNAELLLGKTLKCNTSLLNATSNKKLTKKQITIFNNFLKRRLNDEPLQYILGNAFFCGLHFLISSKVFIPKKESEYFVEKIFDDILLNKKNKIRIFEIGGGCGCIVIALAKKMLKAKKKFEIMSIDISGEAIKNAKQNLILNGIEESLIKFSKKNIFKMKTLEKDFDYIISNPPRISWVEYNQMVNEVATYEPEISLTDYDNGLTFINKIFRLGADKNFKGKIFCEIADSQKDEIELSLRKERLDNHLFYEDINGSYTIIEVKK